MRLEDFLSKLGGTPFVAMGGFADVYPNVRVRGLVQPAIWLGQYALPGEPILVGLMGEGTVGQYVVLGRVGVPNPVEGTVTAAPAGSDTITVEAAGVEYTVAFASDLTPTVGDRMRLMWQGSTGTAICKVGVTPPAAVNTPTTPPPPSASTGGTHPVIATDSATFSVGYGWNAYYGQNLYQGDGSGWGAPANNSGAWFYGAGASQLAGSTVTGVQFRLPARKSGGASSSTATAHIYLHNSPTRPGGDVSRIDGPFDVSVPPGYGGGYIALPTGWGGALVAGGGISITGSPYMGFQGRSEDPASGQLQLAWQR